MKRMPGFEGADTADIGRLIAACRLLPSRVDEIKRNFAEAAGARDAGAFVPEAPSDVPFALQNAAELSFAIGDTETGLDILRDIAMSGTAAPRTPSQGVLRAIAGAIAGELAVHLTDEGFAIAGPDMGTTSAYVGPFGSMIEWPADIAAASRIAALAWPAVVASARHAEAYALIENARRGGPQGKVFDALSLTTEYRASLTLLRQSSSGPGHFAVAAIDERSERQALAGLAVAQMHGLLPVDTLDLGWLAILVGASRSGVAVALGAAQLPPHARYLRELALDIVRLTATKRPGAEFTAW